MISSLQCPATSLPSSFALSLHAFFYSVPSSTLHFYHWTLFPIHCSAIRVALNIVSTISKQKQVPGSTSKSAKKRIGRKVEIFRCTLAWLRRSWRDGCNWKSCVRIGNALYDTPRVSFLLSLLVKERGRWLVWADVSQKTTDRIDQLHLQSSILIA